MNIISWTPQNPTWTPNFEKLDTSLFVHNIA